MELAALIKGANSPSQTYSRRSQLTIHQRFPREYSTSHCQFTPKVQWQWWLTFIEYLLCTRLCLAKLMRLTSLWCSVSEPQPNTQLTPKPMILSTRVLLREMCLLSYHLNHPPCPPALSSLTWRPRTKPGNQSLFTEGVGLPRISFALFPQLQAVFLLWEMPGNLTLQILAEKLPCPDQPNPKPQLLFHRCPQSGGACPAPPLQQNQLGMAAQIGDIYYTAPSTPPMSFCDLSSRDKAIAKGRWVKVMCMCHFWPMAATTAVFPPRLLDDRSPPSFQSMVSQPAAVTSPVNLLHFPIIGPQCKPTE